MTSAIKVCLAAGLALLLTAASRADDIPMKQTFVAALQQAIRTNDTGWMANHTRFPLQYGRPSSGTARISVQ
jgi:hypothetical protein